MTDDQLLRQVEAISQIYRRKAAEAEKAFREVNHG